MACVMQTNNWFLVTYKFGQFKEDVKRNWLKIPKCFPKTRECVIRIHWWPCRRLKGLSCVLWTFSSVTSCKLRAKPGAERLRDLLSTLEAPSALYIQAYIQGLVFSYPHMHHVSGRYWCSRGALSLGSCVQRAATEWVSLNHPDLYCDWKRTVYSRHVYFP